MPVTVRAAGAFDLPEIAALYADVVREDAGNYEYDPPDPEEMAQRFRAISAHGFPYLVAELDGGFAGFAYVSSYRTRAGYRWTVEDSVYVVPQARGRGVGSALLGALVERCTESGYRQMIAVIGDRGNRASIALHARLGFRIVGVFEGIGFKHGRWLDNVQMLRTLGPGNAQSPESG